MNEQTVETQGLAAELKKLQPENEKLKPALKDVQENLVALENYTRRENLRFMNIPERRGENCQDIIHDVLENDLKMNVDDVRFHAVHRVGKPQNNGATYSCSVLPDHCKICCERRQRCGIQCQKPAQVLTQTQRSLYYARLCSRNPERKENPYIIHVRC